VDVRTCEKKGFIIQTLTRRHTPPLTAGSAGCTACFCHLLLGNTHGPVRLLHARGDKDKDVARYASLAIGNLVANNAANHAKFGENGALDEVVKALRVWGDKDKGVVYQVSLAIRRLALDVENKAKLQALGAFDLLDSFKPKARLIGLLERLFN
jgi:hypothetical protein